MGMPTDVSTGIPTHIQEYDGFDIITRDSERWSTPTTEGSTAIAQSGGELVFTNTGAGTKGLSYYETIRKFGKNWRITTDLKLATATGTSGEVSLHLYKNSNCYLKIGPYKTAAINCNCYLRYKKVAGAEVAVALTGDAINTTEFSNYTIGIINDTILIYYNGIKMTSMPFQDLYGFKIRIEAGTGANTDTLSAKADDYEVYNHLDTLLLTIGKLVKDINESMGTSIVANISGNITLASTTEQFLTFDQATYGTKFKVNLLADLEGCNIDQALLKINAGTETDYTTLANNLKSNTIPLCGSTPTTNDAFYFRSLTQFHRLDVYIENGKGNTLHTYAWEYWNGSAWASVAGLSDGTSSSSKVFGKSGKVTWTSDTVVKDGYYQIRARVSTAGAATNIPTATHMQITKDSGTGFDSLAAFCSTLTVSVYRKRGDGSYATLPSEVGLPYTQCILYRNVAVTDLPAWTDIKIGFKLDTTPTASITVPYTGFIETIEV